MKILIAVLVILVFGASSCTPTDPSSATNPAKRMNESALIAIRSQISADPRMTGSKVEVTGDRNKVVLSGTVNSQEQKNAAEELVKKYDSALEVENSIEVNGAGGAGDPGLGY